MKTIYVVGSINTDMSITAPYLPERGETLTGGGFITARGGKGANQAVAAARLGGRVVMCARVGRDAFGREAVGALKQENIDVRYVFEDSAPTGTAVILVIGGDNRIILDRGANAALSRGDVEEALKDAKEGDILLAQLENPIEVVGYSLRLAKEKGMFTVLNPAPANVSVKEYLPFCDLVIPNETETEILGGEEELKKEVKELLITLGKEGCAYYSGGNLVQRRESFSVRAVDTTGAGDTFCGALTECLARGEGMESAIVFATAASALACTKKGAQIAIPKREDVERFLKEM